MAVSFQDKNHDDLQEITICYDNAQGISLFPTSTQKHMEKPAESKKLMQLCPIGNLSFGLRHKSKRKPEWFQSVFQGLVFPTEFETNPLCVYFCGRGKFQAYAMEYYGR